MKILILNANHDLYSLGWSYKRAFESLGHEVKMIDPVERLSQWKLWSNRYTRRILERPLIEAFNRKWLDELIAEPVDLIWVGKGAWAVPWLWRQLKEKRPDVHLVCFNGDDPLENYSRGGNRPWVTESIGCFDLFCTYNSHLINRLYEAGAKKVACIPFAWDPDIHPNQPYGSFERDLLFIGNGDTHRAQWLRHILSCPAAKHWKVSIYGSWAKAMCRPFSDRVIHRHVFGLEMAKLIASSRITLNILRVQNEGSHNMRTFETPGCGGLLASQFSDEQSQFLNGEDTNQRGALLVSDPEECVDQIERHLRAPELCESIARIGTAKVADQTYQRRAEQTLDALGIASC